MYFPEGAHIFYGQMDRCTRCDRFLDEHGGPVMCMMTISLGDIADDDGGEADAEPPESEGTDYAV